MPNCKMGKLRVHFYTRYQKKYGGYSVTFFLTFGAVVKK